VGDLRSGRQELKKILTDLCYSCHTNLYRESDYLHGPLNVGECLFCHDPHQSGYVHLQKAPEPDLCYRCHRKEDIATVPGHPEYLEMACTDCHDPHGSSVPDLLKPGWQQRNDLNATDPNENQPGFLENIQQEISLSADSGFEGTQVQ